jgi:hypothetical protein
MKRGIIDVRDRNTWSRLSYTAKRIHSQSSHAEDWHGG